MRRRFISVLLLLILLITPVFANTDWIESKTLGNMHKELEVPYLSSISKGTLERKALPYPANIEIAVEYEKDGIHPLSYTLYLYEKNVYVPVTLTAKNKLVVTISDDEGESITINLKKGVYEDNRITLNEMQSLAFTEMMFGSSYVDIKIVDFRNVYTFIVDTRRYVGSIVDMLYSEGATRDELIVLSHPATDIASFVARNMKYVVTTPSATQKNFENLLLFMMDYATPEIIQASADVLWSFSYAEWLEYFGDCDIQKADAILNFIGIGKSAPVFVAEEPVYTAPVEETPVVEEPVAVEPVVEEPVVEEIVEEPVVETPVEEEEQDPDKLVIKELVIEKLVIGDTVVTEDNLLVATDVPEEDDDEFYIVEPEVDEVVEVALEKKSPYTQRNFFMSAKTYGMGVNVIYAEEGSKVDFPLGGALDIAFFGGHHGVSIETGYVWDEGFHQVEPGISYLYKIQNSNNADIDLRLGAIANIKFLGDKTLGYSFGGRLGLEMNFFMGSHAFFNVGMHARGLSPVFLVNDGFHMTDNKWNLDFELGAGIGIAF